VRDDTEEKATQPEYIIKSTSGQFDVKMCANYNQVSSTTNGHYQQWCYKNKPSHGNQCGTISASNTYGPTPHEAGQGGYWVHGHESGVGGFSCGFGNAAEASCSVTNRVYAVSMYACVGCTEAQI